MKINGIDITPLKASELITELQSIINEFGDIPIQAQSYCVRWSFREIKIETVYYERDKRKKRMHYDNINKKYKHVGNIQLIQTFEYL